jgi:hypothetical protein
MTWTSCVGDGPGMRSFAHRQSGLCHDCSRLPASSRDVGLQQGINVCVAPTKSRLDLVSQSPLSHEPTILSHPLRGDIFDLSQEFHPVHANCSQQPRCEQPQASCRHSTLTCVRSYPVAQAQLASSRCIWAASDPRRAPGNSLSTAARCRPVAFLRSFSASETTMRAS